MPCCRIRGCRDQASRMAFQIGARKEA
jgi:hypothetical protein